MSSYSAADLDAWIEGNWDPDLTVEQWWTLMAESGLTVPHWPAEYYGKAQDPRAVRAVSKALRRHRTLGPPAGLGLMLSGPTILEHGTPEQCARYLPDIVLGRANWCQLFSEPEAGSDLANVRTTAVRDPDGDGWLVQGQKVWTSNGQLADYGMLLARTNDGPRHRNLTWFVIDMNQLTIDVRPLREMTGRSLFTEVFLDGARVHDSDIVGGEGNGWAVARTTLRNERQSLSTGGAVGGVPGPRGGMLQLRSGDMVRPPSPAASGTAIAMRHRAFDALLEVGRSRGLLDEPSFRDRMAEMYVLERAADELAQARPLTYRGRAQADHRGSVGKLLGNRITKMATDVGMSALGGDGLLFAGDRSMEGMIHELCLFAPAVSIYGGTDQIQRNVLAERVLGLPREDLS
ncbi:MAG: acyl-CoA dehydrogenase family protein [bacterium]|nr:acyl-CoA dehydrogenase family protein [bacterium]